MEQVSLGILKMNKSTVNQKIILLIDDDELILNSLKVAFTIKGYNVITAPNGREGIKIFQKKSKIIDYIVLDKSMPSLDGTETLKKLKSIDKNCTVFMMSGYFTVEEEILLKKEGVNKLFNKPFSLYDMLDSFSPNNTA